MYDIRTNKFGLVLIELLTIVTILLLLSALAIPTFRTFYKEIDLTNSHQELINILITAQNRTLASEQDSQWGLYFSTSSIPHQYVLFKGSSYATRDISVDEIYSLPDMVEISKIDLVGGGKEIVFNRVVGDADQLGEIELRLIENISKTKEITIKTSGQITSGQEPTPSDQDRIKDSRHVHFTYTRQITISTDILRLTFTHSDSSKTSYDIIVDDNIVSGQLYWEGEVSIDNEIQKLKIHTHRLNNLDTEFSIHRDQIYNTKALTIELTDDVSGNLIVYSENGQTTQGTSIYVSQPQWQ
jgi:Tfp pilus assembly protein FimT